MTARRHFIQTLARATLIGSLTEWVCRPADAFGQSTDSVSIRDYGARGDGVTDDTSSFSRAMDALPSTGGSLLVPKGTFLVNPLKSIVLRDGITLRLSRGATLQAIAVAEPHYAIVTGIQVSNIAVVGGTILGDRSAHSGVGGEWGMGINIAGCTNVRIENVQIRDCWGDGIYVGGTRRGESRHVLVQSCVVENNRRQGLSMTGCIDATIDDCAFNGTHGTAPQSGIDLEPNGNLVVREVRVARCTFQQNKGFGLVMSGANVSSVSVEECQSLGNAQAGIALGQASHCVLQANDIKDNGNTGLTITQRAHDNLIVGNVINGNSRAARYHWDNVALGNGASNNTLVDNIFVDDARLGMETSRSDIQVGGADCISNQLLRNRVRVRANGIGGIEDHGLSTIIEDAPIREI